MGPGRQGLRESINILMPGQALRALVIDRFIFHFSFGDFCVVQIHNCLRVLTKAIN